MVKNYSNNGIYWVVGLTVLGVGGCLLFNKWYEDNLKSNPAFTFTKWITGN